MSDSERLIAIAFCNAVEEQRGLHGPFNGGNAPCPRHLKAVRDAIARAANGPPSLLADAGASYQRAGTGPSGEGSLQRRESITADVSYGWARGVLGIPDPTPLPDDLPDE